MLYVSLTLLEVVVSEIHFLTSLLNILGWLEFLTSTGTTARTLPAKYVTEMKDFLAYSGFRTLKII